MAGLNDLITNKEMQTTTMPSWFDTAQQNVVNQALGTTAPPLSGTAAQTAVNTFGQGSPYAAGQSILQSIGTGAANPWMVSTDATGAQTVTPNVATPLGGLFSAQRSYLEDIMPDIDTAATAPAIASGGFGSRMNLSGIAREREKAFSDLAQKQMQAALQSQQYGVSAGAGLGQLGESQVKSALETGKYQQNAPYSGAVNIASILRGIQVPQTQTKSKEVGGLNQIMGLLNLGEGAANTLLGKYVRDAQGNVIRLPGLLEKLGVKGGLEGLFPGVNVGGVGGTKPFETVTSGEGASGTYDPESGMVWYTGADGAGVGVDSSGNYYSSSGDLIWSPAWGEYTGGTELDIPYEDSESTEL